MPKAQVLILHLVLAPLEKGDTFLVEGNKYENMSLNFHNKVRDGYLEMANNDRSSWSIVGATNLNLKQQIQFGKESKD